MKRVGIADLKAHLSAYIREVRGGEVIVVCKRDNAVAELRPLVEVSPGLTLRMPLIPPGALLDLPPVPLDGPTDVVAVLREERDRR